MRQALAVLALLLCSITSSLAQFSVSIGVNLPVYPQLVRVPGYPVYYAPQVNSNYFFYDGMYWVYVNDNWYASTWYNGPWELVAPDFVPLSCCESRSLLPRARVLPWLGRCAPAVGRSLGQHVVRQPSRLGQVEPQRRARAGAVAGVSAPVFGQPLSACRAADDAANAQLSLRASRRHRAAAVSSAACANACDGDAARPPAAQRYAASGASCEFTAESSPANRTA
jgi:hypothetical protein